MWPDSLSPDSVEVVRLPQAIAAGLRVGRADLTVQRGCCLDKDGRKGLGRPSGPPAGLAKIILLSYCGRIIAAVNFYPCPRSGSMV